MAPLPPAGATANDGAAAGGRAACAAELRRRQCGAARAAQPCAAGGAPAARAQGKAAPHVRSKPAPRSATGLSLRRHLSRRQGAPLPTLASCRSLGSHRPPIPSFGPIPSFRLAGAAAPAAGSPSGTVCVARCPRWRRCGACGASSPSSRRRSSATRTRTRTRTRAQNLPLPLTLTPSLGPSLSRSRCS